jgi:hypothetical protein
MTQDGSTYLWIWPEIPLGLKFLLISLAIILIPLSFAAIEKISQRPHPVSITSFFIFYFIGPFFSLLFLAHTPAYSGLHVLLKISSWIIVFPHHAIALVMGIMRVLFFWPARRSRGSERNYLVRVLIISLTLCLLVAIMGSWMLGSFTEFLGTFAVLWYLPLLSVTIIIVSLGTLVRGPVGVDGRNPWRITKSSYAVSVLGSAFQAWFFLYFAS